MMVSAFNSSDNLNYSWQETVDGIWQDIQDSINYSGLDDDTLLIHSWGIGQNSKVYRCRIFNDIWDFYSDSASVYFMDSVSIVTQPANQSVMLSGTAEFLTQATGEPMLHFQWYRNSIFLDGEIDSILRIENVMPGDTGMYYCEITNSCGSLKSDEASLHISNLGFSEMQDHTRLFIRPNPTADVIFICSEEQVYIKTICLLNNYGQEILRLQVDKMNTWDYPLYMNDLARGMYILMITTDEEKIIRKIVVR
jgi:hypothetical protein